MLAAGCAEHFEEILQAFGGRHRDCMHRPFSEGCEKRRAVALRPHPAVALGVLHPRAARGERIAEKRPPAFAAQDHDAPACDALQLRHGEQRLAVGAGIRRDDSLDAMSLQLALRAAAERRGLRALRPFHRRQGPFNRCRADENRQIEFSQLAQRDLLDFDRRKQDRASARGFDEVCKPLSLLARAGDQDAAPPEIHASSARILSAPRRRNSPASSAPSISGSSPSACARATRRPSLEATSARKRSRAPCASA